MDTPSSDPRTVTLYRLTSETVLTGSRRPPKEIKIIFRSAGSEGQWFGRFDDETFGVKREFLPVHCVTRSVPRVLAEDLIAPPPPWEMHETEEYYFAVEPALKKILSAPFAYELKEAQKKKDVAIQRQIDQGRELARTIANIDLFQRASLLQRLWIALRPVNRWPTNLEPT